jgi:hypothetical protein
VAEVNVKQKSAVRQDRVRPVLIPQNKEEFQRRQSVNLSKLDQSLDTIGAIAVVLDHASDLCQNGKDVSNITAGLAEMLKVVHCEMGRAVRA